MPTDQTIAVVMTTYDGAAYLEAQLGSILSQTLQPEQIIICDDLSSDDTVAILEKYAAADPRIRYHVNETRLGVIGNFKKAVSLATTDLIALSDQDDIWVPEKLERLYEAISTIDTPDTPVMVYSDLAVIDQHNNVLNPSFWNELGHDSYTHCFQTILYGNFVTGCTILMNRNMQAHFLVMPEEVLMHDAWIGLIAFSFGRAAAIKQALVRYRRHGSNLAYTSTHRKKRLSERIWDHIRILFTKKEYLEDQLAFVRLFNDTYEAKLSREQAIQTAVILQLQHRSSLRKMMAFRRAFRGYRLSS